MELTLHFPSLMKQGFTRANHLPVRDSRTAFDGDRRSWPRVKVLSSSSIGRSKKGSIVCCKSPSDEQSSGPPSKSKQEEIISLFSRIQASISKGESQGADEKNINNSSGNGSLSKAILDVLEKPRTKTEGDAGVRKEPPKKPPSRFAKRSPTRPSASVPRELKEVAKNRGFKGYSKLKKSEILDLLRSS
ncbi:hypothetical protein N665_0289s0038 [Sinapis alba]|nr:hypothetical protein N665_0289s0038 [Sinapis alba]